MKLLCLSGFLAAASAFSVTPSSFTAQTYSVGEKGAVNFGNNAVSHRTRRATVVMDGKANGTSIGTHPKLPIESDHVSWQSLHRDKLRFTCCPSAHLYFFFYP